MLIKGHWKRHAPVCCSHTPRLYYTNKPADLLCSVFNPLSHGLWTFPWRSDITYIFWYSIFEAAYILTFNNSRYLNRATSKHDITKLHYIWYIMCMGSFLWFSLLYITFYVLFFLLLHPLLYFRWLAVCLLLPNLWCDGFSTSHAHWQKKSCDSDEQ